MTKQPIIQAICQSVFAPAKLARNAAAYAFTTRYGWTLIIVRWLYYSIVFQFRDYHGRWPPFSPPPFGLSIDTYARLQRSLSLPFGVALMLLLTAALVVYLRRLRRGTAFIPTLNTLGTTFFLPFLLSNPSTSLSSLWSAGGGSPLLSFTRLFWPGRVGRPPESYLLSTD